MSSLRPSGRKTDITSYRPDASRIAAESSRLRCVQGALYRLLT